jgi:transcriptional regulator with XRE-family HTH domain
MPRRLPTTAPGLRREVVRDGHRQAIEASQDSGRTFRRLRLERNLSAREVAAAIGVHAATVRAIEAGDPHVSLELRARYAVALGSRLRLTSTETPGAVPLRDRVHALMHEAILALLAPAWRALPDRPVNHEGIRGSIDLVLVAAEARIVGSTEVKSLFVSLEELIRRSGEKRAALAGGGTVGLADPGPRGYRVAELVVVRDTDANRAVAALHRAYLDAAFPGPAADAIAALTEDPARLPDRSLVWLRTGPSARFLVPRAKSGA